ncbi:MAG: Hsp20/alpha crystallin family protein [Gemmatimonadetes bacterium]|nr:Hsp20/alpha crystallin family protein [Gemmatimonadota bacterium]
MAVRTLLPSVRVSNRPWRNSFDNLFDAFFGEDSRLPVLTGNAAFSPRIDVKEDDASYEISAELPGLEEKDIEITVDDGTLVLRGEKSDAKEEKEGKFFRQERIYGRFERAFHLPDGVQDDAIEAQFKNGVLTLHLPKKEEAKKVVRQVEVKTG